MHLISILLKMINKNIRRTVMSCQKFSIVISLCFTFLMGGFPCLSMDPPEERLSLPSSENKPQENDPLLGSGSGKGIFGSHSHRLNRRDPKEGLNSALDDQSFTTKIITHTALLVYSADYNNADHSNLSLDVLYDFDHTFFDDLDVPRQLVRCCHPWILDSIKWIVGAVGAAGVAVTIGPFSNVDLGDLFAYEIDGRISDGVFGTSVALNVLPAFIIFYNGTKWVLQKVNSSFKAPDSLEDAGNCHFARVFPKSKVHRALEGALFVTSFIYGLEPALAFALSEDAYKTFGLGMSVFPLIYYSAPFIDISNKILRGWYANNSYIGTHHSKELRRAFVIALKEIEDAVALDPNGHVTRRIWDLCLAQNVSRLSALLSKGTSLLSKGTSIRNQGDLQQEMTYVQDYNRSVITALIQERTRSEKTASFLSTLLTGASLVPGYMTEASLVSQAEILFSNSSSMTSSDSSLMTSLIPPPSDTARGIGYGVAALLATRLPIEREMHRQNFISFSHPFTPEVKDHVVVRRALGVISTLSGLYGGALFGAYTYQALKDVPSPLREIMTCISAVRYASLFFYIASHNLNRMVTNMAKRKKNNPGLQIKKAHIFEHIRRAKEVIKYELTDETMAEVSSGIYNTK
jgi:hypothetical protein